MLLCHSCGHFILDVLRLKQIVSDNYSFVFTFLNILLSAFIQTFSDVEYCDISQTVSLDSTNGLIAVPNHFCTIAQSIDELIECVFSNILPNYRNHDWLRERAILAPKNIHINAINFQIQAKLPGVVTTYKSIDSVTNQDEAINYTIEFLNLFEPVGMPPHCLNLKFGLIILLQNINPQKLCNGTKLTVKMLLPNLIEARILTAKSKEVCLIPRIPMIPTDMPFKFKPLQYPVRLSFAMSINKAEERTLNVCGVNLEKSCFSHGQLYVVCSRVGTPSRLYIHAQNKKTKNIVYPNDLD